MRLNSPLAIRLIRTVFYIYFGVALVITLGQLVAEFNHEKQAIKEEVDSIHLAFAPALYTALWNLDDVQVKSIVDGIQVRDSVLGVEVEAEGKVYASAGRTQELISQQSFLNAYHFAYPISIPGKSPNADGIGQLHIYSSPTQVIERIKLPILLTILSAIIKTTCLWFIIYWAVKRLIVADLFKLQDQIASLEGEFRSETDEADQRYSDKGTELDKVARQFKHMREAIVAKDTELSGMVTTLNDRNTALEKAEGELRSLNEELEQRVTERTAELELAQRKALDNAEKAGMATIASEVIHNVGNVLNSASTSADSIKKVIGDSRLPLIQEANALLKANMNDLERFVREDPKAKQLLQLYIALGSAIEREHEQIGDYAVRLLKNINMIRDIIVYQQRFAKGAALTEQLDISSLVDETLALQSNLISRSHVKLTTEYAPVSEVYAERLKVVQILMNLIKNAVEAMRGNVEDSKSLSIAITQEDKWVLVKLTDSGCGIAAEDSDKLFHHGFTTKSDGHGFGLHSCANFMSEMGGSISATSEGLGEGSTFILRFSIEAPSCPLE